MTSTNTRREHDTPVNSEQQSRGLVDWERPRVIPTDTPCVHPHSTRLCRSRDAERAGFEVSGLVFGVYGLGCGIEGCSVKVEACRVQIEGFRVHDAGVFGPWK